MLKSILLYFVTGIIVTVIIGAIIIPLFSIKVFLWTLLALGILLFIPLLIRIVTSNNTAKPTIYGTSAPGKFTTIQMSETRNENKTEERTKNSRSVIFAAIGSAMLLSFFIYILIFM